MSSAPATMREEFDQQQQQQQQRSGGLRSMLLNATLPRRRSSFRPAEVVPLDGVTAVAQPAYSVPSPVWTSPSEDSQLLAAAAYVKAMRDTTQMFVQQQPPSAPIIIHNNASAETMAAVTTTGRRGTSVVDVMQQFWSCRLNRLLVCGVAAFTVWLIMDIRRHNKRAMMLRRRLELSPLLRISQWVSSALADPSKYGVF